VVSNIAGPAAALIAWLLILREEPWRIGWKDAAFWILVAGTVAARLVEISRVGRPTPSGAPATTRDARRFAALAVLVGAAAWTIAQATHV
jgi:hypothetical protein